MRIDPQLTCLVPDQTNSGALDVRKQLSSSIEIARHPKYVTLHKDLLKGLCIMQACLSLLLTNNRAEIPAVVRSILEQTPLILTGKENFVLCSWTRHLSFAE